MLNDQNSIKENLEKDAKLLRDIYLKKPFPKGNISIIELHLKTGIIFGIGATSRVKSPVSIPKAKSQGGQFEAIIDSYSNRLMDTDAEYKGLSAIADTIDMSYDSLVEGVLYLYTERKPCESCQGIIKQFQEKYPNINIETFWDYPYP
ncbi:deaminase domain-containing protein [Crocosphaera sp. Alani8]|uniref:deaminase domain-containing protein n=1 Tax=Crocosphaera sp. Alani8 TaxID=3038952 RepID=UPI00313BC016